MPSLEMAHCCGFAAVPKVQCVIHGEASGHGVVTHDTVRAGMSGAGLPLMSIEARSVPWMPRGSWLTAMRAAFFRMASDAAGSERT